jgi:hypothetical protein
MSPTKQKTLFLDLFFLNANDAPKAIEIIQATIELEKNFGFLEETLMLLPE